MAYRSLYQIYNFSRTAWALTLAQLLEGSARRNQATWRKLVKPVSLDTKALPRPFLLISLWVPLAPSAPSILHKEPRLIGNARKIESAPDCRSGVRKSLFVPPFYN